MPYVNRTYRMVDGERIGGSWRHIFLKNGNTYVLSDLKVYADGMIDCWGLVDLTTFQQKVASGRVATTFPQNAQASAHLLGGWRFDQLWSALTPQQLIAEVTDEIEHLAERPTSEVRCIAALDRYLDDLSAENLTALRDAYVTVPEHLRLSLLGDQDAKDWPLRVLITPVGEPLDTEYADETENQVQASDHESTLKYVSDRRDEQRKWQVTPPPWEDDLAIRSPSVIRFDKHGGGPPSLANGYPAPITIDGQTYPTIEHAYWALATSDPDARERITNAPTAREARNMGQAAQLRSDWNVVRLAVLSWLVREKFRQHPDLAAQLIATGDGRLIDSVEMSMSRSWGSSREERNWLGRILEPVRAELLESAQPGERMSK